MKFLKIYLPCYIAVLLLFVGCNMSDLTAYKKMDNVKYKNKPAQEKWVAQNYPIEAPEPIEFYIPGATDTIYQDREDTLYVENEVVKVKYRDILRTDTVRRTETIIDRRAADSTAVVLVQKEADMNKAIGQRDTWQKVAIVSIVTAVLALVALGVMITRTK